MAQGYSETILYSFPTFAGDGLVPDAALLLDSSDKLLFGATFFRRLHHGLRRRSYDSLSLRLRHGVRNQLQGRPRPHPRSAPRAAQARRPRSARLFSAPFVATVVNSSGAGVSGVTVTFSLLHQAGGASGTFAGGANTEVTDATGVATSGHSPLIATAGSYTVTATAPNVSGAASFALTNIAAQVSTTVTVTTTSSDHGATLPPRVRSSEPNHCVLQGCPGIRHRHADRQPLRSQSATWRRSARSSPVVLTAAAAAQARACCPLVRCRYPEAPR